MSTTRQHDPDTWVAGHDGTRNVLLTAGLAVTGVLGYGIAVGLARATEYAEKVEKDEYCATADGVSPSEHAGP
jgi:hypothetical protein